MRGSVLLDGPHVERWADTAIRTATEETSFEVTDIVVRDDPVQERDTLEQATYYLDSLRDYGVWGVALAKHRKVDPPAYLRKRPLSEVDWADSVNVVRCEPIPAEPFGEKLPENAVETVERTDVTFRHGFGILQGDVLTAAEHGVLSYHHGDLREYRGRPTGFWEFFHGEDEAGVTLQKLTETLDGGKIAAETSVDVSSCDSFWAVKERLFEASVGLLADCLGEIEDGSFEPVELDDDQLGPLYSDPGITELSRAYWRSVV